MITIQDTDISPLTQNNQWTNWIEAELVKSYVKDVIS